MENLYHQEGIDSHIKLLLNTLNINLDGFIDAVSLKYFWNIVFFNVGPNIIGHLFSTFYGLYFSL